MEIQEMSKENGTEKEDLAGGGNTAGAEPIFALDIGTHSIIGIVGVPEGEMFRVLDSQQMDHPKRAMIDGQIEDIEGVAATADAVRRQLEQRLGLRLRSVSVAAAGRALKTQTATYEMELEDKEPIRSQQILDLEMGAIQKAEGELMNGDEPLSALYCVGHSVMHYYLDDYPISTLLGHHGQRAKVDIIATFLPGEVVESLYSAMKRIGLNVASVTLEPIAAMNAIIPQELRMLNLALVDIGAGTSDIAISREGSVTAYTMATVAGDEITEAIVKAYLVDFETAEQMKLSLSQNLDKISYEDILGFAYTVSPQELMEKIRPAMENLCAVITDKILQVNEGAPSAVFMVGGGSRLPSLCKLVAEQLSMEETKVAVGGNNYMKRMVLSEVNVRGPEFATPMGIALTAMHSQASNSFSVTLNGKPVRLFKTGPITVMDLLLMNGFRQSQLIGRSGKSVTFELDGRKRVVRGGHPTPAVIRVGGQEANISTPVRPEDRIEVIPAVSGEDACPLIRDVVEDYAQFELTLNGAKVKGGTLVYLNGSLAEPEQAIQDLDHLQVREVHTVSQLCEQAGLLEEEYRFIVNGLPEPPEYTLAEDDDVRYYPASLQEGEEPPKTQTLPRRPSTTPEEAPQPMVIVLNSQEIELMPKEDGAPYLFVDMLNFVDIDPSKPQGNIILKLNGRSASYLEPIRSRDVVDIHWEN